MSIAPKSLLPRRTAPEVATATVAAIGVGSIRCS